MRRDGKPNGEWQMLQQEHIHTAQDFLQEADREFAEGKTLQASEKLWGAAAHSVMAMAQQRGWQFGNHYALKEAVERLIDEMNDPALDAGFMAAEKFHANFYHGFMEDFQIDTDRPKVRRFVNRVSALMR